MQCPHNLTTTTACNQYGFIQRLSHGIVTGMWCLKIMGHIKLAVGGGDTCLAGDRSKYWLKANLKAKIPRKLCFSSASENRSLHSGFIGFGRRCDKVLRPHSLTDDPNQTVSRFVSRFLLMFFAPLPPYVLNLDTSAPQQHTALSVKGTQQCWRGLLIDQSLPWTQHTTKTTETTCWLRLHHCVTTH